MSIRTIVTIAIAISIGKMLEYLFHGADEFFAAADAFAWTAVKEGQPFHFCAVFYRELVHGGFPPLAFFQAIGDIMKEGPATVLTMAVVLFVGVMFSYDRKDEHPLLTTLFLAPIIGGCLLYVVMGLMAFLSVIFGLGAKLFTFIGSAVPLVKEGVGVAMESRKEKMAERIVDQFSGEVRKKV